MNETSRTSGSRDSVASSILDLIGHTPVVRLSRLEASEYAHAELYLKLEYQNPGGSHKARIALGMIRRAEERGDLTRGSGQTVLEPTGGNTGLGLAIACNIYGYRLVLVVPDNYSAEKQRLLRLYGATVVLSDSSRGNNSHGELAHDLLLRNPDWVLLNQQRNPANPEVHRTTTAKEILSVFMNHHIDFFVGGVGTGGHITGIGEILKEAWPSVQIIVVQPEGSDFRIPQFAPHRIQGLAVGLVPDNLNQKIVDDYLTVSATEALASVRKVIKTEGIGVGISTGANIAACLRIAESTRGARILCLAYDQVNQYLNEIEDG
ncbi:MULTISPECIES: cysteine synthase family protein [unclassified Bradyrhizobium]|uniref:PLP-dependent cysteine synthase family protein n=1 Tax=unclassified Bradyrhizobium TaxID=2631580 RepID=UPI0029162EB9|nr:MULTISPECIES: cysteine synthase family protein [unclassified Bradyrhizobium]